MSNVRAAPAWLTGAVVDRIQANGDHAAAMRALAALGLQDDQIVDVERIAALRNRSLKATAADLIFAAIHAIDVARRDRTHGV